MPCSSTHKATHTLSFLMIGSTFFFFFLNNIYYLFSLVSFYGVYTSFSILTDVAMICSDTFSLISL